MQTITFRGNSVSQPVLRVPGWGGGKTDQFQPWHSLQFSDTTSLGAELTYPYDDATVSSVNVEPPFRPLSDQFYELTLETVVSSSLPLLILPHYRFYTDETWSTPLPVAASWDEWWPLPFTVVFRHTPAPSLFKRGEPFAQVIPHIRDCRVVPMQEVESEQKKEAAQYIQENASKYITRKWVMANGTTQDNLYNILSQLSRSDKLPVELGRRPKKFRLIGGK